MSQGRITKSVINYLELRDFTYIECLGEGAYGSVIAVLTPEIEKVAVKIVQESKIWKIEDTYWPILQHANILEVTNTMTIDELNVKLYFMPILPEVLDYTVYGDEFKRDPNSLNRVKKWFCQILAAIEYLHNTGFCHLDIKTDNVLLDEEDNAILCDFSGLNFANTPLERIVAPPMFWPKECFSDQGAKEIRGIPFDVWSFSLLVLNVLTDHYPQTKLIDIGKVEPDWEKEVWPILEKASSETTFKYQMRRAFPNACLSDSDIYQALHFVKFIMKVQREERPAVSRVKMHPFLKTNSNPFLKELNEHLRKETGCTNPFIRLMNSSDPKNRGDMEKLMMPTESIERQKIVYSEDDSRDTKPASYFQHQMVEKNDICCSITCEDPKNHGDIEESKRRIQSIKHPEVVVSQNNLNSNEFPSGFQQQTVDENVICDSTSCDTPNNLTEGSQNKKISGRNMYNWFRKQFHRVFKRKRK